MGETQIGKVTHFYGGIGVAVIELTGDVSVGETIHFKGAKTDFTQEIDSMQIEHENVDTAKKGESIGMKTAEKVREGDLVFKE